MMRYPTGFPRQVLWGAVLLVYFGLALLVFNGYGLVMDWLVLTAFGLLAPIDESPLQVKVDVRKPARAFVTPRLLSKFRGLDVRRPNVGECFF